MDFGAPVSTWVPSPPQWPAVTLTFDLQNVSTLVSGII